VHKHVLAQQQRLVVKLTKSFLFYSTARRLSGHWSSNQETDFAEQIEIAVPAPSLL
jgi:hypothetical protein